MPSFKEKEPSQPPNLPSCHHAFIAACRTNDLDGLTKFNTEFSRVVNQVEQASCPKGPDDKAVLELLLLSNNVHITSTVIPKIQLEIEEISNKFAQQLNLLPESRPNTAPAQLVPSSQSLTRAESTCSNLPLKKWSLMHMSYLFPSKEELEELAGQTSMSPNQINLWFRNARTRSGWSKVFSHSNINKDRERLVELLENYDNLKFHGATENFKSCLARDELLQIVDKVFRYFSSTKQSKPSQSDSIRPWVKDVLSNALATLKDKTAGALHSSRQKLPSLPSRKRARTKKFTAAPSPSQSSTPIAGTSRIPSLTLQSSRSSLSLPTTTGSSSSPVSISAIAFSPFLGSPCPSSESLFFDNRSPSVSSSLPRTRTPIPSPSSALETTPSNSESVRNPFIPSDLLIAHPASAPSKSTDPDQFEDADET